MPIWDPEVLFRVVWLYPGYPFLIQSYPHRSSIFMNVRSNAPNLTFSTYKLRILQLVYTCKDLSCIGLGKNKYFILSISWRALSGRLMLTPVLPRRPCHLSSWCPYFLRSNHLTISLVLTVPSTFAQRSVQTSVRRQTFIPGGVKSWPKTRFL